MREFWFSEQDSVPYYLARMMDRDTVHMYVSDLADPEQIGFDCDEEAGDFGRVNTDFVCFLATPCVVRQLGYNPECMMTLKDYKVKAMSLIKFVAPMEIKNSMGLFRERIQRFLNDILASIYYSNDFEDAKSYIRDLLCFLGTDYILEAISEEDVYLYNTSYLPWAKVLKAVGLVEELRVNNSHYSKKIPEPSLWDYRDFLRDSADFIAAKLYKSFIMSKTDPSNRGWVQLYDEAEHRFGLIVNELVVRVPSVATRNSRGEIWELRLLDYFYSELKKKILSYVEFIPVGEFRKDFCEFHLFEEIQKILNPRVKYRPWVRLK